MTKFNLIFFLSIFTVFNLNAQQNFCENNISQDYFPLTIEKKTIHFGSHQYVEFISGSRYINGKKYIEYTQKWQAGHEIKMYLRKEKGKILQYEKCCDEDSVRFDNSFKKGDSWMTSDSKTFYTILSYEGVLETPICNYKNLLVIKTELSNGIYQFYYKKGYGYIGATQNEKLISYVSSNTN
ncbi:hypothetical protein [Lacinutrix chionoecetis]